MANQSGTITTASGYVTISASQNDVITFTPTAGSYTVEYPIGSVAINASSSTQTLSLTAGGLLRFQCITGSLAYALTDYAEVKTTYPTLAWSASSLAAAPVAGPVSAFGVLAPLSAIKIPANTLTTGSRVEIDCMFLRTGSAATLVATPYFGNTNDINAQALSTRTSTTATSYFRLSGTINITSQTTFSCAMLHEAYGVGSNIPGSNSLYTAKFDWSTDSYVTFAVNPITGPDTCALISYNVRVFQ